MRDQVTVRTTAEKAGLGNANWDFFGGSGIISPSGKYAAGPSTSRKASYMEG